MPSLGTAALGSGARLAAFAATPLFDGASHVLWSSVAVDCIHAHHFSGELLPTVVTLVTLLILAFLTVVIVECDTSIAVGCGVRRQLFVLVLSLHLVLHLSSSDHQACFHPSSSSPSTRPTEVSQPHTPGVYGQLLASFLSLGLHYLALACLKCVM